MSRRERILALFPRLHGADFRITSPPDDVYNCIAWCAGDVAHWWWPVGEHPHLFWPDASPEEETVDAFLVAFGTLGYSACSSEVLERGVEKIALFAKSGSIPTHGARQLPNGFWTSKLGMAEDVEHSLHDVEGDLYGVVVSVLSRRSAPNPSPHRPGLDDVQGA